MAKLSNKKEDFIPYELIIVDGKNMCFKYYHGMKHLKNKEGIPTGLYHGFLQLLTKLRLENMYARIIVVWEGGELVRKKMMKSYKSHRPDTNECFEDQCYSFKELLGMLGIEQKYSPGYEADDAAAALANKHEGKILLVTGDDDWLQIMKDNIYIFRKSKSYSYKQMEKQKGFPPNRIMIWETLRGKPGNNVKAIPFFPEQLALEMVKKCSIIDEIFIYDIPEKYSKWKEVLVNNKQDLLNKHEIISLKKDVRLENLPCQERNLKKARKTLMELQLFKVLKTLKAIRRLKKSQG